VLTGDGDAGVSSASGEARDAYKVHELGQADGPTLVLLHGLSDSGLCWPDAVRRWLQDFNIVAPDARGHGESPRFDPATAGSNRFDDLVADVVSLLESLADKGAQTPILIGHSMGAGVAGTVLATRPDLVRAVVLEDPQWFTTADGGPRPPVTETLQQSVQPFRDDLEAALVRGSSELPLWPEIELRPWALSKAQLDPSLTDREQITRQAPWIEVAAAITRPALVVTGGRDEAVLVSTRSRQRLADLGNRQIEVEVVPGAGHTVRRDRTDAYHQVVDPWITRQFSS
jgi:pimeloyl-ACP methyl ester carboxylesterase